jgi:hypothetical protein
MTTKMSEAPPPVQPQTEPMTATMSEATQPTQAQTELMTTTMTDVTQPIQAQTEPLTATMSEATQPIQPPVDTRSLSQRRPLALIGGAILLLVVAGAAFFFGTRWSNQTPVTVTQTPATPPPPPVAVEPPKLPPAPPSKPSAPIVAGAGTGSRTERLKRQGNELLNSGHYHEALMVYKELQRLDPGNKDVYYLIGQAHQGLGQPLLALQAYRQCTSGPYAPLAQQHARNLEKKLGKGLEKSLGSFRKQ